jgi:dTDP-4-amino-4,6-dideoxygalactose transaminase
VGVVCQETDLDPEVPLLDLKPIHAPILTQMKEAAIGVIDSNRFIGGPEVEGFEHESARYLGVNHAVGVSSGTDALIVSMMALGIRSGDEVIVPSFTFFATAGSVHRLGAIPVFCDILDSSFNMDPVELERLITGRTKAVIVVHLFGQAADMDRITNLCRERGIAVIEDAAQAIGAEFNGQRVGSIGDAGCFSFFPSKNLGGIGDGGLVSTNDAELANKIRSLRDHGATRRYYHAVVGGNFRLDAIQAAVLRVKLKSLEDWHEQRRANAAAYTEGFRGIAERGLMTLPQELPGLRHVFNQYVIRVPRRDGLQEYLSSKRIGSAIYYPVPLHLQECFRDSRSNAARLPRSEEAAKEVLALPVFPGLTDRQRDKVIRCVTKFLEGEL